MADEIISRDQNFRTVGAGVSNDSDKDILMLRVDPITKRLLIKVTAGTTSSATSQQIAQRDQNFKPVCLGWDDTNKCLQEILTDSQGNLLCQFD